MTYKITSVGLFGGRFDPLHNGHINAIIRASKKIDQLFVVISWSKDDSFSINQREAWLHHTFKDYKNITILSVERNGRLVSDEDWYTDSYNIRKAIEETDGDFRFTDTDLIIVDKVFVGSDDHPDKFNMCYPEAEYVVLDSGRDEIHVSATEIRNNPSKYFEHIPRIVRKHFVKKVLVAGPGKTVLTSMLRNRFNTVYVSDKLKEYEKHFSGKLLPEHYVLAGLQSVLAVDDALYDANKVLFIESDVTTIVHQLAVKYPTESSSILTGLQMNLEYEAIIYVHDGGDDSLYDYYFKMFRYMLPDSFLTLDSSDDSNYDKAVAWLKEKINL